MAGVLITLVSFAFWFYVLGWGRKVFGGNGDHLLNLFGDLLAFVILVQVIFYETSDANIALVVILTAFLLMELVTRMRLGIVHYARRIQEVLHRDGQGAADSSSTAPPR